MGFLKYEIRLTLFIATIGYYMVLVIRKSEKSTWKHIFMLVNLIMFGGFVLLILANELSNKS